MALAGGLDALVDSMLDGRLTTPREVIADREERLFIHSLKRRMGYTPPFSHFENEVIEMNSLFSAIYSHRSLGIMDAAMKAFSGGSAGEKAFTEFGIRYASTFLKNATMLPDENKLRYAALYISSVYIILGEIKH
ncbi:hypothetical protein AW736_12855 [Termitidicoccus mucosus]|uniref:Uncharacterized protein n=2 Tax=Termitidicoccus mucosus TaxID=1184151 RepID=A0A178IKC0_9BACT|nr:hypothetical protein AW736_12855 [Opitutaceae bacterium TSB47]